MASAWTPRTRCCAGSSASPATWSCCSSWRRGPSTGSCIRCFAARSKAAARSAARARSRSRRPCRSTSPARRCVRRSRCPTGERADFALRWGPVGGGRGAAHRGRRRRRPDRGYGRGVALMGGRARHLRGHAPGAHAVQLARAAGPHLSPDRRDRGRSHDVAARRRGRRAQLGLPLLLDQGREPHAGGPVHRHVPGGGRGLRLLHDELRRREGEGRVAADHVRHRRRARPVGARASAPARLARLAPGARRQRRVEPDPARRVRRAAEHALPVQGAARRPPSGDPGVRGRAGGRRRRGLARGRRRHVGDARRAAPPPVLEGAVLDRARPRGEDGARARAIREGRGLGGGARPRARGHPGAGLERAAPGLRAVVRLGRARRRAAADADPRLPPGGRPAHALDDRGDRPRPDRGRIGAALSQHRRGREPGRPQRRGGHVRDLLVLAGVLPGEGGGAGAGAASCSTSSPDTRTISGCWQRRSIRCAASCWETSRRRSATSG